MRSFTYFGVSHPSYAFLRVRYLLTRLPLDLIRTTVQLSVGAGTARGGDRLGPQAGVGKLQRQHQRWWHHRLQRKRSQ